ncbi:PLP-dependent aminotransferase family protein [Larkinella terrae]|uniref:Aminotransferase class I/II-fold pyridoxal phosphate-dependent enzyme n=1 Tax=Larkinella terrae TaxID=2025311 RepID=A0A7K0ERV7_9BACT|nr:PLP-dependent aminotransferase family protein [Larkinella terrae]MRS64512.1 aminotransferase class I/II-fold pyridoxal phosphate-dependent enzyme [Larkinella terrae]
MTKKTTPVSPDFLYQQIADRFEHLITSGVLKTGDKLPSVRALSDEQGISLSTAFRTYCELEAKGMIEARTKSGYYVSYRKRHLAPAPVESKPDADPARISVDDMIAQVYQHRSDEGITQLALATPALELLPQSKLNKALVEALRTHPASCLNYEEVQGNRLLRKQIARYAVSGGITVTENEVVTTHGCVDALTICLRAVTVPGDTVAIDSPTYFGIFSVLQGLGLKALQIPTHPVSGLDLDYLENSLNNVRIAACLFVPTFNNPTGSCMSDDRKQQLVNLLANHEVPLIEDDIYGELYFGKQRPRTCKSYDQSGLVMLCTSVSKTLAPGYRVGWCLPGRFLPNVLNQKRMTAVSSTTVTQLAVGLFFENGRFDLHMRNLRKALHTQCLQYSQAISAYFPADSKMTNPQGGYVLWLEMNQSVNAYDLFQTALRHKISIAPGPIFSTDGRFSNYFRMSFGRPFDGQIEEGLKKLGSLIQ